MIASTLSYAQNYEDLHLLRCFGAQASGVYIDIGAGHPVFDNVSFAFYLRGWSGITIEPNPWLAQLSAAVRPRDRQVQALIGATPGEATYYLVEHFHGLSTTVESHARAAEKQFGKSAEARTVAVTTLRALCEQHAPGTIDFLKIDVEGAEHDVLTGNDWQRFRPKVVVAEALAPLTLTPAFDHWEPILLQNDYRFALFDGLNRYYVAEEHAGLIPNLAAAPPSFDGVVRARDFKPALDDAHHPDHRLATLLDGADMVRLPLMAAESLAGLLTAGLSRDVLAAPAADSQIALAYDRLFATQPSPAWIASLELSRNATIGEFYRHIVVTETFRAACGRISASYAW